jgi:hypothetical protein
MSRERGDVLVNRKGATTIRFEKRSTRLVVEGDRVTSFQKGLVFESRLDETTYGMTMAFFIDAESFRVCRAVTRNHAENRFLVDFRPLEKRTSPR